MVHDSEARSSVSTKGGGTTAMTVEDNEKKR